VAAFESSRWWRLHPGLAVRGLWARQPSRVRPDPGGRAEPEGSSAKVHPLTARFRNEIFEHGDFSRDWFTRNIAIWEPVLGDLEDRGSRVLELGSFEGLSACFFLWRLRDSRVTCVDNFTGPAEYEAYGTVVPEHRFDANVALVDATRVRKLVGNTDRVLVELLGAGEQFDVVYVDASHRALDVMVDAVLSWKLLSVGGILIFDDYDWASRGEDPLLRPAPAIDAFLDLVERHSEILVKHPRQVIARKTGDPEDVQLEADAAS
jgi:predicted O-methyltransferase YrrM